jgi:hypothetical protein
VEKQVICLAPILKFAIIYVLTVKYNNIKIQVCKANHFLSKIYSLRNFEKNPLFAKNKFNCSGCKIER